MTLSRLLEGMAASACEIFTPVCIARLLGAAADLLGDRVSARRYYEQALAVTGKIRFRPEIALTHLGLAELLLQGDASPHPHPLPEGEGESNRASTDAAAQRTGALGHLDFAIAEFRDMKMQPSLERALRHKEVLKA